MSVKFEKETIRDTPIPGGRRQDIAHEIGEKLTGGGGPSQTGYLAVILASSSSEEKHVTKADLCRPTSSNSRKTLCALRCLHRDLYPLYKKF